MIGELKPYATYKPTEIPWLDHVPAHWDQRRMKFLFRERNEKGFADEPLLAATQSKGVVRKEDYGNRTVTATKDFHLLKLVDRGDFVISLRSFEGGIEVSHARGIISPAYTVLQPSLDAKTGYYSQLFKSYDFISSLSLFVTGIREGQNIDYERMGRTYLPMPPQEDQLAIGKFLQWTNGRLDRTIRAKRKVIALLNEQKQAIIHRAVTRGLDPSVPLKPSGVPWLGDTPQHWEVRRVKQATRILRGKFSHRPRNDASLYDGSYPFIQTGAVAQATKFITRYNQTLNEKGLAVSKLFPNGTLVMTIAANIGEVAILTFDACFPDSIVGFVPSAAVHRDYLYLAFICMKAELLREAPVNTQGNLNVERIGAMWIPFPSPIEQREIALRVEEETSSFDNGIARLHSEIELLREYRTRLIADIVTGQLDVREAAKHLPDEAPLEAPEDDPDLIDEAETPYEEAIS